MNYIELLNKEEKVTLCEIITGKEFKELFRKNEREFSKIQKGFRSKSLTDQYALFIATINLDSPFIITFINTIVEHWLSEIQENIEKLENENYSHSAALATTMLDSYFANNIELYFKLTGNALDSDKYSYLYERMDDIRSEREKNAKTANCIEAIEKENRRLSDQIESFLQSIDTIKAEYEERMQTIEQDKKELTFLLAEAESKISKLQSSPSIFENNDSDYLLQFDDTDISALPSFNADEIVSLCGVTSDYNGQKCLIRYADLNNDGHYYIFRRNEDIPPYFTNRDKIFYKDGPSKDDFYGIWTWSAVPNENDSSKDYILSRYNAEIEAIELVAFTQATSLDELTHLLKEGIDFQPHSQKVMFSIYTSKGQYTGILCTIKELTTVNGITTISEDCIVVPVYEFTANDIIHLSNRLSFYRNAFAGLPTKLYHLKSPLDIVKDIILSSISWSTYKAREVTRTQYKSFRDFMGAIPTDDITCKIGSACHCSNSAAKELLDKFLTSVWKYVDGESLEDEIVRSAISASTELQEKAKDLIRQDWEKENERLLTEVQQKLDLLRAELKSTTEDLSKAQEVFQKTKAEEEHLSAIIAEKKQLAEDVEKSVAERIQKARKNAANFIACMAFVNGQQRQSAEPATPDPSNNTSEPDTTTYYTHPPFENLEELEIHHSWEDVFATVICELAEAGVAGQCRKGLAAFLCAAYIQKQPILLVGPNAIDIAQAFSAAVTAHKHGLLCCEGNYDSQAIFKIGTSGESIVIVNNLITSSWINRLPEILNKKDVFYLVTHPYAEDIQSEPKSLYGFMLPIFTEFLVDKKASGKYYGGYFSDSFQNELPSNGRRKELKVLSKIPLSFWVRKQINTLVAGMHSIYPDMTADDEFLFSVFPIAYASMEINKLTEIISNPQNNITVSANLKRNFQYILGDL